MPVLGDETGGLGEGAVLVLHDEATLLPVAQQDGKFRLGAMNLTDVLNLSLIKHSEPGISAGRAGYPDGKGFG